MPLGEETRIFDLLPAAEALAERLSDDQRLGRIAGYLCIHFSAMGAHDRAIVAGQRALALAISSGAVDIQVAAQTGWAKRTILRETFSRRKTMHGGRWRCSPAICFMPTLARSSCPLWPPVVMWSVVWPNSGLRRGAWRGRRGNADCRGSRAALQYCRCAYWGWVVRSPPRGHPPGDPCA